MRFISLCSSFPLALRVFPSWVPVERFFNPMVQLLTYEYIFTGPFLLSFFLWQDCPDGLVTAEILREVYVRFYPFGSKCFLPVAFHL